MASHPLYRAHLVRWLRILGQILAGSLLVVEPFFSLPALASFDGVYGIHAVVGLIAVVMFVVLALLLATLIRRTDDYYGTY